MNKSIPPRRPCVNHLSRRTLRTIAADAAQLLGWDWAFERVISLTFCPHQHPRHGYWLEAAL